MYLVIIMKALKIIKNVLIGLVIAIAVLVLVLFFIYPKSQVYVDTETHPYINWMTDYIYEGTLLTDIVIPGAHDAGTANLDGSMFQLAKYLLICQNSTIKQQLEAGVRYFDLRTKLKGDTLYIQHGDFICQKFSSVVQDLDEYLKNQKDFLILNLQHFSDDESAQATFDYLDKNIENFRSICLTKDECDFSTLTLEKIKSLGKRLLIIWGSSVKPDESILFDKGSEGVGNPDVLYSPYVSEVHKSSDEELLAQFDTYIEESKNCSGLFNLQCQRTWSSKELLKGPEQLEKRFADKANEYLNSLTDEQLEYINIVHRDFVTDGDKIKVILKLNERKGNAIKFF